MIIIGVPVAVSMCLATIVPIFFFTKVPLMVVMQKLFTGVDSLNLLAIPFFMFAGGLLDKGGVSRRLINLAQSLVGWMPGGLAIVTFLACAFFGAISGSSSATVVAIGSIMVPAMLREGYPRKFVLATIASAGWLGIVIPPSVPMILYGITANASVGAVFMGGFIPGFLCAAAMSIYALWFGKKHLKDTIKPFSLAEVGRSLINGIWALLMPLIILGGIYGGIFPPPEAAAVASLYGIIIGFFVYRELNLKVSVEVLRSSILISAMVLFIIAAASGFGYIMSRENIPMMIANQLISIADDRAMFWLLTTVILFLTGMILETSPAILILTPILVPMLAQYDISPIAFGVIMIINLGIGYVTPPVGLNLYVSAGLVNGKVGEVINRHLLMYVMCAVVILVLLMIFPQIIMLLPNMMK